MFMICVEYRYLQMANHNAAPYFAHARDELIQAAMAGDKEKIKKIAKSARVISPERLDLAFLCATRNKQEWVVRCLKNIGCEGCTHQS